MLLPVSGAQKKGPIALDPVYYITTPFFVTKANQTEYHYLNIPVNPLCIMVKEMEVPKPDMNQGKEIDDYYDNRRSSK